ncbi:MAG: carbonic anhydrase [Pyrinomonadaceae bacterium]
MFDDIKNCLWIGCSDIPGAGDVAIPSLPKIIFHDNIANLVAVSDFNCLSAMQYAVDLCRVETIVICGHYGCRGVATAVADRHFDFLSNWLNPVVGVAAKYRFLLDRIADTSDRLDALCELNVIEQVAAASRTTAVRDTWESGQSLAVRGLIYNRHNRLVEDFQVSVSEIDSATEHKAAIATLAKRWNIRRKI